MKNQEKDDVGHHHRSRTAYLKGSLGQTSGGDKKRPLASKVCKKAFGFCHLF
jgi:hypothetical protein